MIRDVRDHRETSSMRHPHDHLADPIVSDQAQEVLEHRNQGVESFE